jgi:hypothetical protein
MPTKEEWCLEYNWANAKHAVIFKDNVNGEQLLVARLLAGSVSNPTLVSTRSYWKEKDGSE